MKKWTAVTLVLLSTLAAVAAYTQEDAAVAKAPYLTSFDEAKQLATEKDRPIIIDFYTDWCKWCKKFDKEVLIEPKAIEYFTDEIVLTKINAEVDTALASTYGIMGFPTFVLMNGNGEEIDRVAGFLPIDEFIQTMSDYRKGIGTLSALVKEAQSGENRSLFFQVADKYKYRAESKNAQQWYEKIIAAGESTDSLSGEAYMEMADMYRREGKDDKAMNAYKTIVTDFAGTQFEPRGMLYVGHMNRWADDFEEALSTYEKIMAQYQGEKFEEEAEIYRAIAYRDKGDTTQAINAFSSFAQHWPESEDFTYANDQIRKLRGE